MSGKEGLPVAVAEAIYDVLISHVGANERGRSAFVHHQTHGHCSEYRFMGSLGFGGKFWRNTGYRSDGSWGETWYVNAYPEDLTAYRAEAIERANAAIETIRVANEVQA